MVVALMALIVLASVGSAAVVTYLSNTAHNDVTVTSPLEITGLEIGDIAAGSVICDDFDVTNSANRNICGEFKVVVTDGGEPFDCEGMNIEGEMTSCEGVEGECVESYCEDGVYYFEPCICFTAEATETFSFKITTAEGLREGDYDFDTTIETCGDEYAWADSEPCECDGTEEDMCGWCDGCLCYEGWY